MLSGSIYVLKDSGGQHQRKKGLGGQERQEHVVWALGEFFFLSFMLINIYCIYGS